jgi:transcriptional regulator with XRE-family HTH domain
VTAALRACRIGCGRKGEALRLFTCPRCGRRSRPVRRAFIQAELASAIGRTKSTIALWESQGSTEIRYDDARKCAAALRCSLKDLAAPLDAPLPAAPANWARIQLQVKMRRRRAKLQAGAATGEPPPWVQRFAAILKERPPTPVR